MKVLGLMLLLTFTLEFNFTSQLKTDQQVNFEAASLSSLLTRVFLMKNLSGCHWIVSGSSDSLQTIDELISKDSVGRSFTILSDDVNNSFSSPPTYDPCIFVVRRYSEACVFTILMGTTGQITETFLSPQRNLFSPQNYLTTFIALIIYSPTEENSRSKPELELFRALQVGFDEFTTKALKSRVLEILNHPFKAVLEINKSRVSISTFNSLECEVLMSNISLQDFPTSSDSVFPKSAATNGKLRRLRAAPAIPATCEDLMKNSESYLLFSGRRPIKEILPVVEFAFRSNFTCEINFHFRDQDKTNMVYPDIMIAVPVLRYYFRKYDICPEAYRSGFGFCYLKSNLEFSPKNIYKPLERNVWALFVLTWLIASGTIYLIMQGDSENRSIWTSFPACLWQTIRSLLLQDVSTKVFEKTSNRTHLLMKPLKIFYMHWFPFVIVMHVAYTSNLVSILTSPVDTQELPQSFQELVNYKWAYGSPHGILFEKLNYRNSLDYITQDMTFFKNESTCLEKLVHSPRFACIGVTDPIEQFAHIHFLNKSNVARFIIVRNETISVGQSLGLRWWLPFRQSFKKLVRYLVEGGFPPFWAQAEKRHNFGVTETDFSSVRNIYVGRTAQVLKINHLQGCLLLLICGWLLSCCIVVLEKVIRTITLYQYRRKCLFLK